MTCEIPEINKLCLDCGEVFLCKRRTKQRCEGCWEANLKKTALVRYYRNHEPVKMKTLKCPHCKENFDTKNRHKTYCCSEHRILAERRRLRDATPEDKRRVTKQGWTAKDRKAYGSRYWKEVTLPRLNKQRKAEAEALVVINNKIPYAKLQRLPAEKIVRYWGKII